MRFDYKGIISIFKTVVSFNTLVSIDASCHKWHIQSAHIFYGCFFPQMCSKAKYLRLKMTRTCQNHHMGSHEISRKNLPMFPELIWHSPCVPGFAWVYDIYLSGHSFKTTFMKRSCEFGSHVSGTDSFCFIEGSYYNCKYPLLNTIPSKRTRRKQEFST